MPNNIDKTNLVSIPSSNVASLNQGQLKSTEDKMLNYIHNVFTNVIKLRPSQPLRIEARSEYLPLIRLMVEEAYKTYHSGGVSVKLIEPELEELKKKYNINSDFDYKSKQIEELTQKNAAFISFHEANSPYVEAGLTEEEIKELKKTITPEIPLNIQQELEIDPKEILQGNLSLRKGQPLIIHGEREHFSQILKLIEYAFQEGSKLVNVDISENKKNDLAIPFYKYASDEVLEEVPMSYIARFQEYLDKNIAELLLSGADPTQYEGLDSKKFMKRSVAVGNVTKDLNAQMLFKNPWCIYYLPTTASAIAAYPEYGENKISALAQASREARKINRMGKNEEHVKELTELANSVNVLVKQGYRTIHFVSVDKETKLPDGKTDLRVGLSEKAVFVGPATVTPTGQSYIANTPTEEIFTTPDNTKVNGVVSGTMPFYLNGEIIEGLKIEFKDGKIARDENNKLKISATKNEKVLIEHIEENEGADRLGEVALVAGSPIFDLKRLFKSILIDENAACHIAIGNAYLDCIEGAVSIEDREEQLKYLKQYNVNDSTTHNDFMIGGPNVIVYAEKTDGSRITLIEDNKFCFN